MISVTPEDDRTFSLSYRYLEGSPHCFRIRVPGNLSLDVSSCSCIVSKSRRPRTSGIRVCPKETMPTQAHGAFSDSVFEIPGFALWKGSKHARPLLVSCWRKEMRLPPHQETQRDSIISVRVSYIWSLAGVFTPITKSPHVVEPLRNSHHGLYLHEPSHSRVRSDSHQRR